MNMNNASLGQGVVFLKRSILMNMAYKEKFTRKTCPICEKTKSIDELVCDRCFGRHGDELNDIIHNALYEINPEKYPNKKKTSLNFEIVDKLPSKEIKIIEEVEEKKISINPTVSSEVNTVKEDNFIEVIPGFFLYRDEIEKMSKGDGFAKSRLCPICKSSKDEDSWVCSKCAEKSFLFKKFLIQYAVIKFPGHLNSLDGFVCTQEDEEKLLNVGIKFFNSTKDVFSYREGIKYLKALLRYFPDLDIWKLPVASCIVGKVIFHALAIINGRLLFVGARRSTQIEDIVQGSEESQENLPSTDLQIPPKTTIVAVKKEEIEKTKDDFLEESKGILSELRDNFNEIPRAGKALAAFISKRLSEWEVAMGKKNPDRGEFFSQTPFSEVFLNQLKESGNCAMKSFNRFKDYFEMSGEDILAEGLLILDSLNEKNLSVEASPKNDDADPASREIKDVGADKKLEDFKKDICLKMTESFLNKIHSNLREVPLVARALWAFIKEAADNKEMRIVAFGETINIYSASLSALKIGGNKQQCLSVGKFEEVIANLNSTKEDAIARGLEILIEGGDKEAQEEFDKISLLN